MIESTRKALIRQYEASLAMLRDCLEKCPAEHWEGPIAKYPFWCVAYHTLCYADLYLSPRKEAWTPRAIHPRGYQELLDEYPSRRFEKEELLEYADFCHVKVFESIGAETEATLAGESGFHWYKVPRLEMHFINIRHIQHHTGQLSAFLRRLSVQPRWFGSGWEA